MPAQPPVAFDGILNVRDAMKMSYGNGVSGISYGESYNLEYEPTARVALLASDEPLDPSAELPPTLAISVSFDSKDPGDTILTMGKRYQVTITEVKE